MVLWWVPAGRLPTVGEALERRGGSAGARTVPARVHLRLLLHRGGGHPAP
ncbi:hypothetical protein ACFYV5_32520 [Streptomyces sp. NPDC003035]